MKTKIIEIINRHRDEAVAALRIYAASAEMCRAMTSRVHLIDDILKEINTLPEEQR